MLIRISFRSLKAQLQDLEKEKTKRKSLLEPLSQPLNQML